jgi:hypothetical protein
MSDQINIQTIIDNWVDEIYMNILMYQCEETRPIVLAIDKLMDKKKIVVGTYIIGLLKPINNQLLDKYTIKDYMAGINNLCKFYNNLISFDNIIIKSGWMSAKNRKKFSEAINLLERLV